jgi:hypothetical protein
MLLLAALMLGAGCSTTQDVSTYHRHGFSFDYPSAWNLSEERDPDGGYTVTLDPGGANSLTISTTPNLTARYPPTARFNTLAAWYAESRSRLLNVNATVIEERQETVAGQPANRSDYTISNDDVLYRSALVVTAIGDTGYSFNLWALPESFDTLSGGLKTVLSSFRVDGTR